MPGDHGGPPEGGLAALVRDGRRVARVPSTGRHPQRWLHCAVEAAEGRPLHVVTVYGSDVGQPGAPGLNAELIGDILGAMAELGQARWVIGGDWNEEAGTIWELAAAGHRKLLLPRLDGPACQHARCRWQEDRLLRGGGGDGWQGGAGGGAG